MQPETPEARRRISELKKQRGGILGMPVQDADVTDSIERELKRKNKDGKKVRLSMHQCSFYVLITRFLSTEDIRSRRA